MTSAQLVDERIEDYLTRLQKALGPIQLDQKEDILQEIRAHIFDSTAGASDREAAVDRVLRLLGKPDELAARYTTEQLLTRASRSFSPWLLLRTSWRWAKLGIKGTLAFLVALFGYTMALALTVSVFLKPFMPDKVGMWVGRNGVNIGPTLHPAGMHEVLGNYFVPVIGVAAFAFAIGTTHALRWLMRKRSPAGQIQPSVSLSAQVL
jgi:uncharacterized membrane protein